MAIEMNCPHCDEEYSFPERRRGEKAECGTCERGFTIGEKNKPNRSSSRGGISKDRNDSRGASAVAAKQKRYRDDDDDDDDDRPRRRGSKNSVGPALSWWEENFTLVVVGGIAGFLVIAGLIGFLIWNSSGEPDKQPPLAGGGPPPFGGDWPGPGPGPGGNPFEQPQGQQIAQADTQELLDNLKQPRPGFAWNRQQILEELGKRNDVRSIPGMIELLPDFFDGGHASNALRTFGPKAEKDLIARMNDGNENLRNRVRELLKQIGTKPDALITRCLLDLNSNDVKLQTSAAIWFAENKPEPARMAEVADALVKNIESTDAALRDHSLRGLKEWGSKENTVAVANLLEGMATKRIDPGSPFMTNTHKFAFEAIRQWKDPRAASAVMQYAGHFFIGGDAMATLKELGPEANATIVKFMHHPNNDIANATRNVLKERKAADELLVTQTIEDLKSKELERKKQALNWLPTQKPVDDKKEAMSKAIEPILRDPDGGVRDQAIKALKPWAHKECVPALILVIEDPDGGFFNGRRNTAMEIVGELKDARAAPALAARLIQGGDRIHAGRAIRAIGAPAESAVWPLLASNDNGLVVEVLRILQDIGTKKSVPILTKASQAPNRGLAAIAKQTLEKVKDRE